MTPLVALQPVLPDSNPGLTRTWPVQPVPPPPVLPAPASHAVALSASGASVAVVSFQPSKRVLPDWPVPSSIGELSPQIATRPLPKVLVTKAAPVVPEGLEPV